MDMILIQRKKYEAIELFVDGDKCVLMISECAASGTTFEMTRTELITLAQAILNNVCT